MKKARFTEIPIVGIQNEAGAGMKVKDLCRKHGISDATYYNHVQSHRSPGQCTPAEVLKQHDSNPGLSLGIL
jgi:putative transposase